MLRSCRGSTLPVAHGPTHDVFAPVTHRRPILQGHGHDDGAHIHLEKLDPSTNFESALRARKLAEAEDELAQAAVRRAYEENWLDAQKKFGKAAERLLPRLRKRRSNDDEPEGG